MQLTKTKRPPFEQISVPGLRILIQKCLDKNRRNRPTAFQAKTDPWFTGEVAAPAPARVVSQPAAPTYVQAAPTYVQAQAAPVYQTSYAAPVVQNIPSHTPQIVQNVPSYTPAPVVQAAPTYSYAAPVQAAAPAAP